MLVSFQTRSPALWQRWVRSGSIRTDQPGTLPGTGAKGWHGVLAEDGSTEQSRSAGVLQLMGESAAKLAGFSEYFLSSGFGKGEHHFLVFQRVQEGDVVLIINDNHGKDRPEQFQDAGLSFRIEWLALGADEIPLKQAVGEQDEGDLIDDQVERTRGEVVNAGETFQLTMTLFNDGTKAVFIADCGGTGNGFGV